MKKSIKKKIIDMEEFDDELEEQESNQYFGSKQPNKQYVPLPKHKTPSARYSSITEELDNIDKTTEPITLLGRTGMTHVDYVDSMRAVMNSSAQEQAMVILDSEPPFVKTGAENIVGKYSTYHKKANHDIRIVHKFVKNKYNAVYILYDEDTKVYDAIERVEIENRQESSGFQYKNDIDKYNKGDIVPKDSYLYRTTSYDDYDNFAYGRNTNMMHIVTPETHEDAAVISSSFSQRMKYINAYEIFVKLGNDTILLNNYGTQGNYKSFPDIGEYTEKSLLCVTRKVTSDNILSDCSIDRIYTIYPSDIKYFCDYGEVLDIQVYSNYTKFDNIDNTHLEQIKHYLDIQSKYWKEVYSAMKKIKDENDDDHITYKFYDVFTKAKTFNENEAIWHYRDDTISDLLLHFTMRKETTLLPGQKITGRYGNKCVVSSIIDDEYMPRLDNGEVVDVLFFGVSPINRTVPFALIEPEITFTLKRIREYMSTLDLAQQEEVLFQVLDILAKSDGDCMREIYDGLSNEGKIDFMKSTIRDGIFLTMTPFYRDPNEFIIDKLLRIRHMYPRVIKPYDVYVRKFGKRHLNGSMTGGIDCKTLRSVNVGQMYLFVLKQTALKGFSARNAGSIDIESLPQKSFAHTNRTALHSNKPIRIGEYDLINMFIVVDDPIDYSLFTAMYRTSVDGRNLLFDQIFSEDNLSDQEFINKVGKKFSSTAVDLFNIYLKSLGRKIIFVDEQYEVKQVDSSILKSVQFTDLDLDMKITEDDLNCLRILSRAYKDIEDKVSLFLTKDDDLLEKIKNNIESQIFDRLNKTMVKLALKDRRFLYRTYSDYNTIVTAI